MKAYVINLDSAKDRWAFIEESFARTRIGVVRVPAVDGGTLQLPHPDFDQRRFDLLHGRSTNVRELGCYFSHVRAMHAFLDSGDSHGLIFEDDVALLPGFEEVLESALRFASRWNLLRLSGLGEGVPLRVAPLCGGHHLCISLGRVKGAGAYAVDRKAAEILARSLLPMWLPYDHAFDREWHFGLRAACVIPFPCSQTGRKFRTSIQTVRSEKKSRFIRWLATYPYQTVNEFSRWIFRGWSFLSARLGAAPE